MRLSLLDKLACPRCHRSLTIGTVARWAEDLEGLGPRVDSGDLACGGCRSRYPIGDSIPDLVGGDAMDEWVADIAPRLGPAEALVIFEKWHSPAEST